MPFAFGAITGFASARYSKMRVGVLISVKMLRWLGMMPRSQSSIASTISLRLHGRRGNRHFCRVPVGGPIPLLARKSLFAYRKLSAGRMGLFFLPSPMIPPPGRNRSDGPMNRGKESQKDWTHCRFFRCQRKRHADWKRKISSSGELITTLILSRLTTARRVDLLACEIHGQHEIRKADTPLLQSLQHDYAKAFSGSLKIVCMSSGMGSCRSKMIFAPRSFGTIAAKTRTSGMLCTWTRS